MSWTTSWRMAWIAIILGCALIAELWTMRNSRLKEFTTGTLAYNSVTANPNKIGDFFSGYEKIQCHSCPEAATLENPKAPLGFIVGVQKSGTTNLINHMLASHPSVFFEGYHELHALDNHWKKRFGDDHNVNRCSIMRYYNDILSTSTKEGAGMIDKSPSYILGSDIVPQRILCAFPNAKIIMLLRNPVDRCYSHYQHTLRWGHVRDPNESFEEYLVQHIRHVREEGLLSTNLTAKEEYELWSESPGWMANCIARGMYAIQIRQWMAVLGDHFGWDNIWDHLLILEAEEVWKDEQAHLDRILEFLELPPFQFPSPPFVAPKKYKSHMGNRTQVLLERFFQPHNQKLDELLSPYGIKLSWATTE